ncbi:hypothetical protein CPC08DRAFT_694730 [Agrocybe pediades]|nr:hypothetical protein CPC08DRAFT_694730 [Agrocybe pediades]
MNEAGGRSPGSSSVTTESLSGSETGPNRNRSHKLPNTFSRAYIVSAVVGAGETYARSLLSKGNGYSPWSPQGIDSPRSKIHLKQGVGIGDVGLLDREGYFVYLFNIFAGRDHPLNEKRVPEDFEPIPLDQETDVIFQPNYFPPRTIISSKAVDIIRVSEEPFEFKSVTTAREAALLVLPDGASREDLKSTSHLTKYIEKYALSWHYFLFPNATYSGTMVPNGSLYLVTGCDKAESWANAAMPASTSQAGDRIELTFREGDWVSKSYARGDTFRKGAIRDYIRETCAVNIRGITIALSNRVWAEHLRYEPPKYTACYQLLSTPILGWRAKLARWKENHMGYGQPYPRNHQNVPFHPSIIITQILFEKFPEADVAIVHDSVWCNAVDSEAFTSPFLSRIYYNDQSACIPRLQQNGDGTADNILKLIARGLASCDIVMDGCTATLVPKANLPSSQAKKASTGISAVPQVLETHGATFQDYRWAMKMARKIVRLR